MLSSIELVCVATPCQPHQGRFTAKNFIYVFILHQTAFQPSKVVRPLCGSGSRNFINSYRCPIYNNSHPYRCQLFRYWARATLVLSVSTNQHAYHQGAQAAFSDFREGAVNGSTSWLFQPKALQYALSFRDLSIAAVQFSFNSSKLVLRDAPRLHHFSTI